ncbi:MAG: hypothetical protein LBR22_05290 [Desulfovibrio sp.]|jgi:hypothetical protein|nr:hypothetical protein [Desulfovibrio sp.]
MPREIGSYEELYNYAHAVTNGEEKYQPIKFVGINFVTHCPMWRDEWIGNLNADQEKNITSLHKYLQKVASAIRSEEITLDAKKLVHTEIIDGHPHFVLNFFEFFCKTITKDTSEETFIDILAIATSASCTFVVQSYPDHESQSSKHDPWFEKFNPARTFRWPEDL